MVYAAVAAGSFRRYATYRIATAAGVFTNTVFGFIVAYTYIALWDERPHLGGYDQAQALTFVWTGQALLATAALMGGGGLDEMQERIRTGDIAVDLYRPADLQLWWLATDLGRAGLQLIGRGVAPMAVGALAFPLALPGDALTWGWFLLSVLLGVLVSFALRYLVALASFWLLDGSGLAMISGLACMFFTGMVLPLRVFPGGFGEVVQLLPWAAILQVPADVLMGVRSGDALVRGLLFQAVWAVALLALGRLVQSAATRKVVVHGG
ncbi:ABC-2 family transporter protein [Streptomyces libani]|uniref:ABC transporter permease n=2 Tax=Streptomyces nigrescens TaxID=1920 RepID=A0A640TKM3_STRNI|nr:MULTISPECIES: ABC-2 family transporter protein [Streptomyces]MCW7987156.1 ABC transporter permease [Streptomyces platensis subsp. clarensis]MYT13280.1 ABC transporter permease [Streptomyces sp. SID4951]MYX10494.1 ABC transporter permease [Streptomyces sp. SID8375]AWN27438.1 ABC transporter permease [Streptomyces sp. NEAU-S7GS2]MCX5447134.1 ABC-2 family transporter protein [Streptomyces libani]